MTPSRRRRIHRLAEHVRDRLEVGHGFDLHEVAEKLGGKLNFENLEHGAEGRIVKAGDGFILSLPLEARDTRRGRFSFAHELGHLFIHMGYKLDPERWESFETYEDSAYHRLGISEEELDANEFAGAFLMPAEEFRQVARDHLNDEGYQLREIADHFHVSKKSARIRGQWLGLFSWWW